MQNNSKYNQKTNQVEDGTALVVSKALSDQLIVSYNMGIFDQDSHLLTLTYLLNKFFSLQVSTNESGSGMDVLYTHKPE